MVNIRQIFLFIFPLLFSGCDTLDLGGLLVGRSSVEDRFEQSITYNTTHPSKDLTIPSDDYKFLLGSDLHMDESTGYKLQYFLTKADTGRYHFCAILGDFTKSRLKDSRQLEDTLQKYTQTPFYHVLGNHDIYSDALPEFFRIFGTTLYSFEVKTPSFRDLFIVLDSGSAMLGVKQRRWLKDLLTRRSNYRHCFILTHVHFFGPSNDLGLQGKFQREELYSLFSLFGKEKISMVFSGHTHYHNEKRFNQVPYINLSSMKGDDQGPETCSVYCNKKGEIDLNFDPLP